MGRDVHRPGFSPFLPLDFTREARAWEIGGTPNVPGAAGLAANLELIGQIGVDRIAEHINALTERLLEGLDRLGVAVVSPRAPAHRSGITTFTIGPGAADQAALHWLTGAGVAVSVRYSAGVGGVRVSCHLFNTADDVDRLLLRLPTSWRAPTRPGRRTRRGGARRGAPGRARRGDRRAARIAARWPRRWRGGRPI